MNLARIENLDLRSKRIFLRLDFDVAVENEKVLLPKKIENHLATLEFLIAKGAKIILGTHFGTPNGEKVNKYSIKPIKEVIEKFLVKKISYLDSLNPEDWIKGSKELSDGEVLYLENLAFLKEELEGDDGFSEKLKALCDIVINDSFITAPKTYASTFKLPKLVPSYAGTLLYREMETLTNLIQRPEKPFVAIIGGASVSTKFKMLNTLLSKVDSILLGGGLAYTFLKARAIPIGSSVFEKDFEILSHQFIEKCGVNGIEFQMPLDHIIADGFSSKAKTKSVDRMGILDGWMGLDIGSKTISAYEKSIKSAKTIFWSGPMGAVELDKFANGSIQIAKAIAKSNARTIVGGAETVGAVYKAGVEKKIDHLSTGGNASLEFLEGKEMCAITALNHGGIE
ncbi:MAG: phosphoglycerate kinase [Leptospiraceae bacterium]|nr:phosphoglycerate kinase [Leptospiraceae bacterium]